MFFVFVYTPESSCSMLSELWYADQVEQVSESVVESVMEAISL